MTGGPPLPDREGLARRRLRELLDDERRRARFHIDLIQRGPDRASADRTALVILRRGTRFASVYGGVT